VIRTAAAILGCLALCAHAATIHVNADAPSGGNGSSWEHAYNDLQTALDAATTGDQVWVAHGVYSPHNPGDATGTFSIKSNVSVYGGFKGVESSFNQRPADPLAGPSILDGNGDIYHLVTFDNVTNARIDGFVIIDADAKGAPPNRDGAGVFANNAGATLANLYIQNCQADADGGAIAALGSSTLTVLDSTITQCRAESSGGAIHTEGPITVDNVNFTANHASVGAGLAVFATGIFTVENCRFEGNDATFGGGMYTSTDAASTVLIDRCDFIDNSAASSTSSVGSGGAIRFTVNGQRIVRSCRLLGNTCQDRGGGISVLNAVAGDSLLVENSFVSGNSAGASGGGIDDTGTGDLSVVNTTITRNSAGNATGRGIYDGGGDLLIANSIVWGNVFSGAGTRLNNINAFLAVNSTARYSRIGGWDNAFDSSTATTADDPMFVDLDGPDDLAGTDDDDPSLSPGSSAIDAANDLYVAPEVLADINGDPRYADDAGTPDTGVSDGVNPVADIGAAEFQGTTPNPCIADLDNNAVLNLDDISLFANAFVAGDLAADMDDNAILNLDDISLFANAFVAGCP